MIATFQDLTPYVVIRSKAGGWIRGKGVFCRGYNMMDELVGQCSYMQIVVLNITGRLPTRMFADWLEAVHICLSWPDSRIWCNQIGALAGSVGASVVAATCAGVLAADSRTYGSRPVVDGMIFIQDALRAQAQQGLSAEDIVSHACAQHGGKPHMTGYARPITKGDERIAAMERVMQQLNMEIGSHLTLALAIEKVLVEKFDETMNINGFVSAVMSDFGYTATEGYRIFAMVVMSGVSACYVEASTQLPFGFLPLQCADIDYQGVAPRSLTISATS